MLVHASVVAAKEIANASSAKSGFTSSILQPTVEMHHIELIVHKEPIITSLQVLFTNKVTAPTAGLAYSVFSSFQ